MQIEHIAIWVRDLEKMKVFYEHYFHGKAGERYHNPTKQFYSYFLSFENACRLELMYKADIPPNVNDWLKRHEGLNHFAVSVGSKAAVDQLTKQFGADGYTVVGQPRTTGDGYYESVVLDPENNRIEITV